MGKITDFLDSIIGQKKEAPSKVVQATKTRKVAGRYFLFKTKNEQEYLNFLETFNESKYKIVDISISVQETAFTTREYYMVTYKKIVK